MSPRLCTVALGLVGVLCSQAESFETNAAFEASGSIQRVVFGTNNVTTVATRFKMLVSGRRWQLRTFGANGAFSEITCDGESVFHFDSTNTVRFGASLNLPRKGYNVLVEPGPIPSGGYRVVIPWLVYASSPVAATRPSDLPAPWLDPRDPYAHLYESKVDLASHRPNLPQRINFEWNQGRFEKAATSPWLATEDLDPKWLEALHEKFNPRQPFALNGFVRARYRMDAVTNLNDLLLPTAFSLRIYDFSRAKPRRVAEFFYGTNITIKALASKPLAPTVPDRPLLIKDFRFQKPERNISYLRYVSSTWIPSAKADVLQRLFALKLENPAAPPESFVIRKTERKQMFIRVLLAISFLSPLGLILYFWKIKPRT